MGSSDKYGYKAVAISVASRYPNQGSGNMQGKHSFSPGWLRIEIATAIENFTKQSYVSQERQTELKGAARTLENSDRLRRAHSSGQTSRKSPSYSSV